MNGVLGHGQTVSVNGTRLGPSKLFRRGTGTYCINLVSVAVLPVGMKDVA
jgi:hypothetical protein